MNPGLDFASKARVSNVFNRIQSAGYKPAETANIVKEVTEAWGEQKMPDATRVAIFNAVADKLQQEGQGNPDLIRAVTPWAAPAPVLQPPAFPRFGVQPAPQQRFAPAPANLEQDLINLHIGRQAAPAAPNANLNPFAAAPAQQRLKRAASNATATTAGTVEEVEHNTTYAPSERADAFLTHYALSKDAYEALGRRTNVFRVQEFNKGTPSWQHATDALFVIGSIVLDQQAIAEEPVGFKVKGLSANKETNITSQAGLLEYINGAQKKAVAKPPFSENFQTDMSGFMRRFDKADKAGEDLQMNYYYIINGQDNDSSGKALSKIAAKMEAKDIPEKAIGVQAISVGQSESGKARLRKLDNSENEGGIDFFDTTHWPNLDPDNMLQTGKDEDGDDVEIDLLEKATQGGFRKELDAHEDE